MDTLTADTRIDSALSNTAPVTEPAVETQQQHQDVTEESEIPTSGPDRVAWQKGEYKPGKKSSKPAASAAAEGEVETDGSRSEDSATSHADTAADSAAAPTQRTSKSEKRFKELSENYGAAQRRIAELERLVTQPQATHSAADTAKQPDSQPAAAAKNAEPKIDDIDDKGKPKFQTLAEYMQARETWLKDSLLSEFETHQTKKQQERARQEQERAIQDNWGKRVEAARTKHADFDTVALGDMPLPTGSVADAYILDSDHGAEILYYLGQHPDVLKGWYKATAHDPKTGLITKYDNLVNPIRQARELALIEAKFAKPAASSAPRITRAPAPPHEVAGQGTVPPDEVEQALADDDFTAYKAAENRKALARAKGR